MILTEETEVLGEKPVTLFTTNLTRTDVASIPGFRGDLDSID